MDDRPFGTETKDEKTRNKKDRTKDDRPSDLDEGRKDKKEEIQEE